MLITEKFGGIRSFRNGTLAPRPLAGAPPAYQAAQSGLLDIAIDPDFASNRRLFISYTQGDARANRGAIWRARYTGGELVDGTTIFRTRPDATEFPFPIAGRLLFLPDKTLLFTSSDDHSRREMVQRLDNDLGKILRLDRDGRAPPDNPFLDRPGALPEIYTIGNRGPLGLARDQDGQIWETEMGPRGGDELNIIRPGANYGWPIATYGIEYSDKPITETREAPGLESPVTYWAPSISPANLAINLGERYPAWKGDFFVGALSGKQLRRIRVVERKVVEQQALLTDLNERIRDVRSGPDGYLYLLTDSPNGRLLRLRPGVARGADVQRVAQPVSEEAATSIFRAIASGPALSAPDAARGEKLFGERCMSCHSIGRDASPGIGPNLFGVVGRKAGQAPGSSSQALASSGIIWTRANLDGFIAAPQAKVPGTTMTSAPVSEGQARADIIAYLEIAGP